jgi:hypothetical protein
LPFGQSGRLICLAGLGRLGWMGRGRPRRLDVVRVADPEGHRTLNSSKLGHHRKTRVIYYFETSANKIIPLIREVREVREVREKSEVRDGEPPPRPRWRPLTLSAF